MITHEKFHGSYLPDDVEFLLKQIDAPFTSVEEKEKLIQCGKSHYSEMISPEYEPSKEYLQVFYDAFEMNKRRFAKDVLILAENINRKKSVVLVSLVRAGTPIGVLLKRTLKDYFSKNVPHYSISIIRDREIDENALSYIRSCHPEREIVFIDGWTGKGVINRELKEFIASFNKKNNDTVSDDLYVISDIAGVSDYAATRDDYLIPSSTLNSTISGLVSRSILNRDYVGVSDFHGCKFYKNFCDSDLSLWFIDSMMKEINLLPPPTQSLVKKAGTENIKIDDFFLSIQHKYGVSDINYIKPGIGESTRVLLRRTPFLVIVKDFNASEVKHLKVLAKEKNVEVIEDPSLPFTSLSIIKDVS
jgi:hypothetical protein